jgi:tetratricopeptide (TPR) repeat protein
MLRRSADSPHEKESVCSPSWTQHVRRSAWRTTAGQDRTLLTGHREEATRLALRTLELSQDRQERGVHAQVLWLLGEIAMHHDPPEIAHAEAYYRQGLALADELGMRPLQAHCHRGFGTLYSQTGQVEQAHAELSMAIEMYRDMEMTFWLPETEATLTQVA